MATLMLTIEGMHCGSCVRNVTRALSEVPGVKVRAVEIGSATVDIDNDATSAERVADTVTEAGYPARPVLP